VWISELGVGILPIRRKEILSEAKGRVNLKNFKALARLARQDCSQITPAKVNIESKLGTLFPGES
jgi:hypothetical protein